MNSLKFSCDVCLFESKHETRLYLHKQQKHVERIFKCDECDYTNCRKDSVKVHTRIKHRGEKLHCKLCNFQCDYQTGLNNHNNTVHNSIDDETVKCSLCDWSGKRNTLKSHKKILIKNSENVNIVKRLLQTKEG